VAYSSGPEVNEKEAVSGAFECGICH
jgi:hypothetical protein